MPIGMIRTEAPAGAGGGGHGSSEYYMIVDFGRCIVDDKGAPNDVYTGLDYTMPGICAALSSERGGERIEVPDFRPGGTGRV